MAQFKKGSQVQWKWMGRLIDGSVEDIFIKSIIKEIKNKKITRHGTEDNPAYLVCSDAGNYALKLESELLKPQKKLKNKIKPKIFG